MTLIQLAYIRKHRQHKFHFIPHHIQFLVFYIYVLLLMMMAQTLHGMHVQFTCAL